MMPTNPPPDVSKMILQIEQQFQEQNLPIPPLPHRFVPEIQLQSELAFGTRPFDTALYDLNWYLSELLDTNPVPYLLVGHDGRGINSWAMHDYCVQEGLAFFLQTAWGGAYTDPAAAVERMHHRYELCRQLLAAAERSATATKHQPRLIVVVSDFYGSSWAIDDPEQQTPIHWREEESVLEQALAWLHLR